MGPGYYFDLGTVIRIPPLSLMPARLTGTDHQLTYRPCGRGAAFIYRTSSCSLIL